MKLSDYEKAIRLIKKINTKIGHPEWNVDADIDLAGIARPLLEQKIKIEGQKNFLTWMGRNYWCNNGWDLTDQFCFTPSLDEIEQYYRKHYKLEQI